MMIQQIDAYYLRLSLEDGDAAEGNLEESCSISSQRLCIKQFIASHSSLNGSYEEFSDDGYSGTNMDRPGVQRLLGLVKAGMVRTIIVRDLSRFARNYLEAGHYLEFVFPAYGVRFISINDHYDSDDFGENPAGLDLAIRNIINEMYSRDISRKVKSVVDLKKRNGEFVYGTAPYGYKKGEQKNTIVPDEEAASTVRWMFALAAEGKTITQIAQLLNAKRIPTPSEHLAKYRSSKYRTYPEWTWNSVKNILENRIYTGDTEAFKSHVVKIGSNRTKQIPHALREIIPETHEAIISRELYYLALSTIKSVPKTKHGTPPNPLTSKLVCGCCGHTLRKGKAQNKYWLCDGRRYTAKHDCKHVRANEAEITGILLRAIRQQFALIDSTIQEQKKLQKATRTEWDVLSDNLKSLRKKHDRNELQRRDILEAVMNDKISRDEYTQKKKQLIEEDSEITAQIAIIQNKLNECSAANEALTEQEKRAKSMQKYQGITTLTPEIMKALIKRVVVYPDKQIHIEWNFSDSIIPFISKENQF